jgi:hypothetical protein
MIRDIYCFYRYNAWSAHTQTTPQSADLQANPNAGMLRSPDNLGRGPANAAIQMLTNICTII